MLVRPSHSNPGRIQRAFAEAIFSDDARIPVAIRATTGPGCASRFGVYRNNVMASLINAIAARYPVVRKLLWDEAFERVARLYVTAEPPRSPVLLEYGASFPNFLRQIGRGAAADYLADIAELESARTRAYHAADATPVGNDAFASLHPDQLVDLTLMLHPSVALLKSRFPVLSIWEANVNRDNMITEWRPESVLIARPQWDVEVRRLSQGTCEFLAALSEGRTVCSAIVHAKENASDFDLAEGFTMLLSANIVVGFGPCSNRAAHTHN